MAYFENKAVAAICYFAINNLVNSSFYLSQEPESQKKQALSLLVYQGLQNARDQGFQAFDFGTSSINRRGRTNIFKFKESFGAIGQFRTTYKWSQLGV